MLTRRGCVRVCRSSYCLRLFGRLALLALTFLAVLLPFRAIIVCGGLELPAFLAFQNSRHVAKVANELLHKVTVKCVACTGADADAIKRQRHQELADYLSGFWAGEAKPYSEALKTCIQRPQFCPGEAAADRQVPRQPLVLEGDLLDPSAEA